jgi:hypothetical protein
MAARYGPLSIEPNWQKPDFVDKFLASSLNEGSLSLMVGAGASMGFNLPSWDQLIDRIYTKKDTPIPSPRRSAPDLSDDLKRLHYANDESGFSDLVRECMYESYPDQANVLLGSPLLQAIGSLLIRSMRGRAGHLVSFNFDNLIEIYLRQLGFVVRTEASAPFWARAADMTVLHPHGVLPFDKSQTTSKIVFTASDYDKVIGRESDEWNAAMRSILIGTTPIFIGLSGDDQRLRSLLRVVKDAHPGLHNDEQRYWGVRPTLITESSSNIERWKDLGICPRLVDSYDEIPVWLLSICQRAAASLS